MSCITRHRFQIVGADHLSRLCFHLAGAAGAVGLISGGLPRIVEAAISFGQRQAEIVRPIAKALIFAHHVRVVRLKWGEDKTFTSLYSMVAAHDLLFAMSGALQLVNLNLSASLRNIAQRVVMPGVYIGIFLHYVRKVDTNGWSTRYLLSSLPSDLILDFGFKTCPTVECIGHLLGIGAGYSGLSWVNFHSKNPPQTR